MRNDTDLQAEAPPLRRFHDLLTRHGGILRTGQLCLLAAGGTQWVYVDPACPETFVLKIPRHHEPCARFAPSHSPILQSCFPAQWLPETFDARAPVRFADGNTSPDIPIRIQRFDPAFQTADRIGLQSEYPELAWPRSADFRSAYTEANALLSGDGGPASLKAYLACHPVATTTMARIAAAPDARPVLATLLGGIEAYVASTGTLIDLIGADNVFCCPTPSGWTCRIGDVCKQDRLGATAKALASGFDLDHLPPREVGEILNGLSFLRFVNALSAVVRGRPSVALPVTDRALRQLDRHLAADVWRSALSSHIASLDETANT